MFTVYIVKEQTFNRGLLWGFLAHGATSGGQWMYLVEDGQRAYIS